MEKEKSLVYRVARDSLVFAPLAVATHVSQIHRALESATTWGELKRLMPEGELEALNLEDHFEQDEEGRPVFPDDSTPEPCLYIPGYSEGDYPLWVQSVQDRYLSEDLCRKFGVRKDTPLNGSFWSFDPGQEEAMVAALRALGFELSRRDDLAFR